MIEGDEDVVGFVETLGDTVGEVEGSVEGSVDGSDEGPVEGALLTLGLLEGEEDVVGFAETLGDTVGKVEGPVEGSVEGSDDGPEEGALLTLGLLDALGDADGGPDGRMLGLEEELIELTEKLFGGRLGAGELIELTEKSPSGGGLGAHPQLISNLSAITSSKSLLGLVQAPHPCLILGISLPSRYT